MFSLGHPSSLALGHKYFILTHLDSIQYLITGFSGSEFQTWTELYHQPPKSSEPIPIRILFYVSKLYIVLAVLLKNSSLRF